MFSTSLSLSFYLLLYLYSPSPLTMTLQPLVLFRSQSSFISNYSNKQPKWTAFSIFLFLKWTRCNCFDVCELWIGRRNEYPDRVAPIHLHNFENEKKKYYTYSNGAKYHFSFVNSSNHLQKNNHPVQVIILPCPFKEFFYLLFQT